LLVGPPLDVGLCLFGRISVVQSPKTENRKNQRGQSDEHETDPRRKEQNDKDKGEIREKGRRLPKSVNGASKADAEKTE
jgi:hypothetical protein